MEIVAGYQVPEQCRHCGKWHYGKSKISHDVAARNARQEIEKCRKHRFILGLPDEPPVWEPTEADATKTEADHGNNH